MATLKDLQIIRQTAGKCAVELFRNTEVTEKNYESVMNLVKNATDELYDHFKEIPANDAASADADTGYTSYPKKSYPKKSYGNSGGSYTPKPASAGQIKFVKDLLDRKTDIDINRKNEIAEKIESGNITSKDASQFIDELQ